MASNLANIGSNPPNTQEMSKNSENVQKQGTTTNSQNAKSEEDTSANGQSAGADHQSFQSEGSPKIETVKISPLLLSPNTLHERFKFKKEVDLDKPRKNLREILSKKAIKKSTSQEAEEIEIFKTEKFHTINQYLADLVSGEFGYNHCLIFGSVGIGKSFALALNVVELRGFDGALTFYINNPGDFSRAYFFKELIAALSNTNLNDKQENELKSLMLTSYPKTSQQQKLTTRSLMGILRAISESKIQEEDRFCVILTTLPIVTEMKVIVVVDQAFSDYTTPAMQTIRQPTHYALFLRQLLGLDHQEDFFMVFCSSRKPPLYYELRFNPRTLKEVKGGFTDAEALAYLEINFNKDRIAELTNQETLETIKEQTKNIPYELKSIL